METTYILHIVENDTDINLFWKYRDNYMFEDGFDTFVSNQ